MKRFACAMCAMTLLLFGAMPTALADGRKRGQRPGSLYRGFAHLAHP